MIVQCREINLYFMTILYSFTTILYYNCLHRKKNSKFSLAADGHGNKSAYFSLYEYHYVKS